MADLWCACWLSSGEARVPPELSRPCAIHTLRTQRAAPAVGRECVEFSGQAAAAHRFLHWEVDCLRSSSTRAATASRLRFRRRDRQPSLGHDSCRRRIDRNAAPRPRGQHADSPVHARRRRVPSHDNRPRQPVSTFCRTALALARHGGRLALSCPPASRPIRAAQRSVGV